MDTGNLPFNIVHLPRRRPVAGYLVSTVGWALPIVVLITGIEIVETDLLPDWLGLPLYFCGLLAAVITLEKLSATGRKLRQHDALSELRRDPRAPVLLLRSFKDDGVPDLTSRTGRVTNWRSEQSLCQALQLIGPVVALGKPGQTLPDLGASRIYVDQATWKKAVRYFLGKSATVVIIVADSQSVCWEIEASLEEVQRLPLLFFFPYIEDKKSRRSVFQVFSLRRRILTTKALATLEQDRKKRFQAFHTQLAERFPDLHEKLGESQFVGSLPGCPPRLLQTIRPSIWDSVLQASQTNLKVGIHYRKTLAAFIPSQQSSTP